MSEEAAQPRLGWARVKWPRWGRWLLLVLLGLSACAVPPRQGVLRQGSAHEAMRGRAVTPQEAPARRGELGPIESRLVDVDFFQGLLVRSGVPAHALPSDGRRLRPEEALRLLSWVLRAEVPLRDFGPWRMASHLLWEVVQSGQPVQRAVLHARMRRFSEVLVLRPDGYLVRASTGEARQYSGQVRLVRGRLLSSEDELEVGPLYAVDGDFLYPANAALQPDLNAPLAAAWQPDDNALTAALEGAGQAGFDTVEGILALVLHPVDSLEGLAQLPEAVRALLLHSPDYWERFRALPHAAQVRATSRLLTGVLITCGTAGAGSTRAASVGSQLGKLGLPVLSVSAEGTLALRAVALPAGQLVTQVGAGASAFYVLHMAGRGAGSAGGAGGGGEDGKGRRPWPPAPEGPGEWVQVNESMSKQARCYQCEVTGAPEGWVYRVTRNGEKVDFDGFTDGILLDAKGQHYQQFFNDNLDPKSFFQGARRLADIAKKQQKVANGVPIQWHVAEKKAADAFQKLLEQEGISRIEVIHTPPLPKDIIP